MSSSSPAPLSSPSAVSPSSPTPTNSSNTSPPPTSPPSNQTSTSPPPSAPPNPPPSPPVSPPPAAPPQPPLVSPPPPQLPPPSSPPSPPPTTPSVANPPPPPTSSPSPPSNASPPPPVQSPPSPISQSPPPPAADPPTPSTTSPPPPTNTSPPSPSNSSPPPPGKSTKNSPPPPTKQTPPPPSSPQTASPPTVNSPPDPSPPQPSPTNPTPSPPQPSPTDPTPSPPLPSPTDPTSSTPPTISPPAPASNSSDPTTLFNPPLPMIPTEKPTAKSANNTNVNSNAPSTTNGGNNTSGAVAIGIIVGFAVLGLVVMAVWFVTKRKKRGAVAGAYMPSPYASSQNSDSSFLKRHPSSHPNVGSASGSDFAYSSSDPSGAGNSRPWFSYEELFEVTNGFSTHNLLGEGGFGCVYKGCLADGKEVAVKQLKIGGGQGEREFRAEVEIISRVHHRHLVSLVGYCIYEHQRLLVYEYVPNNTLDYHLHAEERPVMSWATRVKVAAGAARGIAYLHEDCHPRIIHRDIKSSNILLDNNFDAQVSDFGLAKLAQDACTHVTTRVMGTFGYMAPEYASSGKLTEKSDVYSFGVVLLELITGRKPVDVSQPLGDESLVEWARPLLAEALEHGGFEGLVDSRLQTNFAENEMLRIMEAAAACVRHSASKRPRMSQVVRALNSIDEFSDLTNGIKPGQSEVFDPPQSAEIRMFQRLAFGSQEYSSGFFNQSHSQESWRS